jgi:hypothetical protein
MTMTAREKAEQMLDDLFAARAAALTQTRGTWDLWRARDRYNEVADLLAKSLADDPLPAEQRKP